MKRVQNFYLKLYRLAAFMFLFSLLLILAGYGYLLVFYIFNSTWAMPVKLTANHQDVIKYIPAINIMETALYESKVQLEASFKAQRLLKDKDGLMGATDLDISAELNSRLVTKDVANYRRIELLDAKVKQLEIDALIPVYEYSIKSKGSLLNSAQDSPYFHSIDKTVTVAFVPYQNMSGVKMGDPVYNCSLKVIWCHQTGSVSHIYDAEVYANHPVFKTPMKGKFVGINFKELGSEEDEIVYIGSKPLLL